ncbi:MAG: MaoC/PaaZ C-terminal domain-containing protein [Dehalococcoidia bacterium]|nr:MaoC/PaaZ C-terminal domain-containing protein [Dehalococcoidia bacterium]
MPTASAGCLTVARTYEITVRVAQAYAAGVGDFNPRYFNDDAPEGVLAPPCLVYSLQWNSRNMPGVYQGTAPPIRGVHAATDLRWERAIRAGDTLTVQGRRIAVRQIPPGVYLLTRYQMRDAAGALVATVDDGAIIRGARTDGEEVTLEETPPLPERIADGETGWTAEIAIAREATHVYTECADIWNPIHTERRFALAAGLPDIIVQGSLTMALAARELVNRVAGGDPARLARLAGQFRAMVIPGSAIRVVCEKVSASQDGCETAFFEVLNARGEPAVKNGVAIFRDQA